VWPNGIAEPFGTALSALLARTSWKVRFGKSGTWTLRSSPRTSGSPGSVLGSSKSSRWASHRMTPSEHMFERLSTGVPPSAQTGGRSS